MNTLKGTINKQGFINAVKKLNTAYQKSYGIIPIHIDCSERKSTLIITGSVITTKQKKQLRQIITTYIPTSKLQVNVVEDVLTQPLRWVQTTKQITDLYTKPIPIEDLKELIRKERNTQVERGSILRELLRNTTYSLVQSMDLTLGWVQSSSLKPTKERWPLITRATRGIMIKASRQSIVNEALTWLEVPYLWGGNTRGGVDCSGYVQQVYFKATGLLLPKHSQDQKKCGVKILQRELLPGDLVFLDRKKDGFHHVGIFSGKGQLLHASLRQKKVVVWNISLVRKLYSIVAVRRIVNGLSCFVGFKDL